VTQERCPQCNTVVATGEIGGFLRCERCGTRFPSTRRKKERGGGAATWAKGDSGGLGIHPALARRYERRPEGGEPGELTVDDEDVPAGVELSPSLLREAAQRRATPLPSSMASEPPSASPQSEPPPASPQEEEHATSLQSRPGALSGSAGVRRESTRPLRPSKSERAAALQETPVQRGPSPKSPRQSEPLPSLPGFQILEQVGKGAMGRVFRAIDMDSGELGAVKLLAPELAARPDFVARFEREAAALKRVDHAGVVKMHRSGSHQEHHWFSMEFVEGVSLRRVIDAGPLAPGRALAFARQITQGLKAAHDVGVIHRDLKPENILVERLAGSTEEDPKERLVLVDFGLAGILEAGDDPHPNLTKSRMTMGTVNYMAPEQRTDAKRVDQRADLYAAGVILYELLTGDLPLGRFALPTERDHNLPTSMDDCIVRALARDPKERFQQAAELDATLASLQADFSKAASMDTLVGRLTLDDDDGDDGDNGDDGDGDDDDDELESDAPREASAVKSQRPAARRGPQERSVPGVRDAHWHTAPPWVKRPELLWGVFALAIGAGGGLLFSLGGEADARLQGPGPSLESSETGVTLAFAGAGDAVRYSPLAAGFSAEGRRISYRSEEVRRGDPAILVHPTALPEGNATVRAFVDVTPRGASGESGYGGVLLRAQSGEAVGVVRLADKTCGVLSLEQGAEAAKVAPFLCPPTEGPLELSLTCALGTGRCVAAASGAPPVEYQVSLGAGAVHLALACADAACSFGPGE
jgi:serine/threonine protein kinase